VWVGIEDPDPLIDGKGIEFLLEKNVAVDLFDRDLQEIISPSF
jgi:ATP-dependent DNA helicase RecG